MNNTWLAHLQLVVQDSRSHDHYRLLFCFDILWQMFSYPSASVCLVWRTSTMQVHMLFNCWNMSCWLLSTPPTIKHRRYAAYVSQSSYHQLDGILPHVVAFSFFFLLLLLPSVIDIERLKWMMKYPISIVTPSRETTMMKKSRTSEGREREKRRTRISFWIISRKRMKPKECKSNWTIDLHYHHEC